MESTRILLSNFEGVCLGLMDSFKSIVQVLQDNVLQESREETSVPANSYRGRMPCAMLWAIRSIPRGSAPLLLLSS